MNKKIISTILAGACALSCMSVVASAADEAVTKQTYSIDAGVAYPTLDVTLPATDAVAVALNPFKLTVKYNDETGAPADDGKTEITDVIASPAYKISSKTQSKLDVSITASATVGGEAKLVKDAISATSTTKDVLLFIDGDTKTINYTKTAKDTSLVIGTSEATKVVTTIVASDGTTATEGYFRINGDLNVAETLKTGWTAKDKVKVKLIIDVTPAL